MMRITTERVKRVLNIAANLIDKGFTKEKAAMNNEGASVSPFNPEASCFCALGAIQLAVYLSGKDEMEMDDQDKLYFSVVRSVRDRARETGVIPAPYFISFQSPTSLLFQWNDSRDVTGTDVSGLFRDVADAVEKLEGAA